MPLYPDSPTPVKQGASLKNELREEGLEAAISKVKADFDRQTIYSEGNTLFDCVDMPDVIETTITAYLNKTKGKRDE